jgi:pilus assembly protein Flp/PilA
MKTLRKLSGLLKSRSGATVIEYALIAGIICLAVVAGASALGGAANDSFTEVSEGVWGS